MAYTAPPPLPPPLALYGQNHLLKFPIMHPSRPLPTRNNAIHIYVHNKLASARPNQRAAGLGLGALPKSQLHDHYGKTHAEQVIVQ